MTTQTTLALGTISFWHIVLVLVVVLVLFGGGRLRNLGSDIGAAIKGFKESMNDAKDKPKTDDEKVIEGKVESKTIDNANTKDTTKNH